MPYPLISGFMSGIGCIIIILQMPAFLGHPAVKDGLIATLTMLPTLISTLNQEAVLVGCTTLCVILFLPKKTLGYPTSIDRINSRQFRWLFVFVWRAHNW